MFIPTSLVLPEADFPQFASRGAVEYASADGTSPYGPVEGENYAGALHADSSWMRLTRTVEVPAGVTTAELQFQMSYDVEEDYDHVIIEARTAGGSDWTTLPDLNGGTSTVPPAECEAGFFIDVHPFLATYLSGADCQTGEWNSFTGSSNGWTDVAVDLTAYANSTIEVSISYVTDPFVEGVGVFVDDTRIVIDDVVVEQDGFEGPTSVWTVGGPPDGSPPNGQNWQIGGPLLRQYGGTSTDSTLLLGFGLEQLPTPEARAELVGLALAGLVE